MVGLLAAIALLILLVYLPGYFLLRSLRSSCLASFAFAPVLSTALYLLLGVVFFRVGVFAGFWNLGLVVLLPTAALYLALYCRRRVVPGKGTCSPEKSGTDCNRRSLTNAELFGRMIDGRLFLVALAFNVAVGAIVFLGTLDGPDSFSQNYDMGHHLSQVMAMVQSGNFSTLNVTIDGVKVGGFYPSVLHVYAALLVSVLGITSSCAINAVLFVFIAIVFPVGIYALCAFVLPSDSKASFCSALMSLVFPAFPWILIRFSALLANVVGFALMPLALGLFVAVFDRELSGKQRCLRILLCVVALGVISAAHPNSLFSAGVFLVPFVVQKICEAFDARSGRLVKWLAVALFLLLCALIWKTVHDMEAFKGVVSFSYSSKASLPEAIANVVFIRFRWYSAILPLAALVLVGLLVAIRTKGCRWLAAVYLFSAVQLVVCSSLEPCALKSMLCGFWYNHDFRLMASFAIFAIPLAGLGLDWIARFVERLVSRKRTSSGSSGSVVADSAVAGSQNGAAKGSLSFCRRRFGVSFVYAASIATAVVLVCFPVGYSFSEGVTTRSLGQSMSKLYSINNWNGSFTIYSEEERDFVQKAVEVLPDGAVVMNMPYDGTAYAYGIDGLNTYFKSNVAYSESGDAEYIVETRLNDIAWDPEVQQAVRDLGIEYVIELDHGLGDESTTLTREYSEEDWKGILSIDGNTQGFEEVLAEGDMGLYRIECNW